MHLYEELKQALLAGFYVPELLDVYFREDNFRRPRIFLLDTAH